MYVVLQRVQKRREVYKMYSTLQCVHDFGLFKQNKKVVIDQISSTLLDSSMDETQTQVDGDHPPDSADHKTKAELNKQKKIWLLTYCPAGKFITADMLKESKIIVDECHSTCDRIMNFTYIHLPNKCRLSQIEKFLEKVNKSHGIVKKEVYGYESIGAQSVQENAPKIQNHVAFKMLVKHFNEGNSSFTPWTDGEKVFKRGLLFQATELIGETTIALENRTKSQLITYARDLEEKVRQIQGFVNMYMLVSDERSTLFVENASLKRRMQQTEAEVESLKRRIVELSPQAEVPV